LTTAPRAGRSPNRPSDTLDTVSRPLPPISDLARPGRRALVAPDLSELRGPTSGVIELPHRLFWQKDRRFDLDEPFILQWVYEMVLLEAIRLDELRTWLHGPTLIRLWPRLYLPRGVRRDWEARHPELRRAA
jgi:hypothetical protein